MSGARVGRAHLLLLLESGGEEALARLARFLDYAPNGKPPGDSRARERTPEPPQIEKPGGPKLPPVFEPSAYPGDADHATFWYAATFSPVGEDIERRIADANSGSVDLPGWETDPRDQPEAPPLAPWRELLPPLQRELAERTRTRQVDLPATVRRLAAGRSCFPLPMRSCHRWGSTITLVEDRSVRLTPYWADQAAVAVQVAAIYPSHGLRHAIVWDGQPRPVPSDPDESPDAVWPPPPESPVLILGDLGGLAGRDSNATTQWACLGAELSDLGCNAVAISPVPKETLPAHVRSYWQVVTWERGGPALGERRLRMLAQRALAALAIATRIEPGLLREVRRALGLPAAVEAHVWQDVALSSRSSVAATLRADAAQALRSAFAELQTDEQERVLERIHAWRGGLPPEVWFAEIQALPTALRDRLPFRHDAVASDTFFAVLGRRLHGVGSKPIPAGLRPWFRFIAPRLRSGVKEDPDVGIHFQRLYRAAFAQTRSSPDLADYDPALAAGVDALVSSVRCSVVQRGCALRLSHEGQLAVNLPPFSWIGAVDTQLGEIKITPLPSDQSRVLPPPCAPTNDFWDGGQPPSWATDWGWDDSGAWVEFSLEGKDGDPVVQRMRWIEPGTFLMGSPDDEPGRWNDEGPRHEVTIREGFWLFDTPCTQALWEAVMGDNPSEFKSPERPVEQVSWEEVQGFMQRINERLPGLELSLPSEAQWEHACRAGSMSRYFFGDEQGRLSEHAWYSDNAEGKTHSVREREPNPWGLYDMLGNVDEWVQDAWHGSYDGAPVDGSAWESEDTGAARVVRGGSWGNGARNCRSACRNGFQPDYRIFILGFRCARVQGREPGKQGEAAERVNLARPGPRSGSGRAAPDSARAAAVTASGERIERGKLPVLLRLDAGTEATTPLPETTAILIRTDREQLTLRRMTEPDWANAIGRDRYGLWTEIAVEPSQGEPVIQRLRWIPPGRFTMGSPEDEPERWEAEGPQHPVVLGTGYWLFDTPCTQALWEALLGENPSRFQDPGRPVEGVSWEDVRQRFLPALNERIPGFVLPSEAQWERACRAGTETALYTGPIEILGYMNAPALDPIAWYGGNSGVDFDLPEGEDTTTGWWGDKKKQYPHERAGTRKVKGKQPNPWGLYDMLGNVWEWCEDAWHEGYDGAPVDGSAWVQDATGADRVIRGGSWDYGARYCRCASRNRDGPDYRDNGIGFRCARVQGREPGKQGGEAERRSRMAH